MLLPLLILASLQQAGTGPAPYWQQRVAYEIDASLDESRGVLSGTQRLRYRNNSPDTLRTLSFHLYLNAFRPGSRWAAADSVEGRRRFNDLEDPNYGFNHVRNVRIQGSPVTATYPFAPDSTIVRFELPRPLAPGGSLEAEMEWDARPSIPPRRQGRRGRAFDFAQWYPRVVVYDKLGWQEHPLYPGGEFYGEFGSFLVGLDLAEDQVVGATGVAVCGDPGWERVNQKPDRRVDYRRDFYGDRARFRCEAQTAAPGRKKVVWFADDVHHFAMSLNPQYKYEGGRWGDVAVHVLYQPGDEKTWGADTAVRRTERALEWLDGIFGRFPWPQLTNVHRIEGGGTEFPMMIHDGSASESLIIHELGHNYVMGILANNEWREGWLDEGFTEFQTNWYYRDKPYGDGYNEQEPYLLGLDLDGASQPASMIGEHYRDFNTYNTAIYLRGELFFHQLRYVVGEEAFRKIVRTYYDRWKLKHVNEAAFRAVAEEVSKRDLSGFFAQWLHTTDLVDYAIGKTERREVGKSGSQEATEWVTRVEVRRMAPGIIPVEVQVAGKSDTATVRAEGMAEREWVEVRTGSEPVSVTLDPGVRTHDWNYLNNHKGFGLFSDPKRTDHYIDTYFSTREHRDRQSNGWAPQAWYNDAGGVTIGLRARGDYFGRFEQNILSFTAGTGWGADDPVERLDFFLRLKNPVGGQAPLASQTFEAFSMEGRYGATALATKRHREHQGFGPTYTTGASVGWVATSETAFLDPGYYERAGTVEGMLLGGVDVRRGSWTLGLKTALGGGVTYDQPGPGIQTEDRYDIQPYVRGTLTATARRPLGRKFALAFRGYAGLATAEDQLVKQRQVYLAGADPYQQLYNPFLRSEGALLVRDGVYYHAPGGAGLRGFDARVSARQAYALNGELERTLVSRRQAALFSSVTLALFGDVALADPPSSGGTTPGELRVFGDAGIGVRAAHRIGRTSFVTRFDFPLYVSEAGLAQDDGPGSERVGFRWLFSFAPAL